MVFKQVIINLPSMPTLHSIFVAILSLQKYVQQLNALDAQCSCQQIAVLDVTLVLFEYIKIRKGVDRKMFFKWIRPSHVPFPNVWLRFEAKDVDSDNLVEYTIKDLPEDRFDEAIQIMATEFLADAPMAKSKNAANDSDYIQDNVRIWKDIMQQRMTHVCFKDGSSEIVGLNLNYVSSREDSSRDDVSFLDDLKSESFLQNIKVYSIVRDYGNFDVYEKYGVDRYLSSFGMYVPKKYAGRKIGEKLLKASKYLAKPCEIKLRHAFFSSNISNKIADNLGYKTDVELSFKEIKRIDPSLELENIESSKATLRTWIFDD